MNDRPTAAELLAAVRHYLETELLPALTDSRLRFQTLVAAHVLGIVERELPTEESHLRQEYAWLRDRLGPDCPNPASGTLAALREAVQTGNQALCGRIRRGLEDEPGPFLKLLREVRAIVRQKLAVSLSSRPPRG